MWLCKLLSYFPSKRHVFRVSHRARVRPALQSREPKVKARWQIQEGRSHRRFIRPTRSVQERAGQPVQDQLVSAVNSVCHEITISFILVYHHRIYPGRASLLIFKTPFWHVLLSFSKSRASRNITSPGNYKVAPARERGGKPRTTEAAEKAKVQVKARTAPVPRLALRGRGRRTTMKTRLRRRRNRHELMRMGLLGRRGQR